MHACSQQPWVLLVLSAPCSSGDALAQHNSLYGFTVGRSGLKTVQLLSVTARAVGAHAGGASC